MNNHATMASMKPTASRDVLDVENDDAQREAGYAWEGEFQRSWDVLQEDESGSLRSVVNQLKQAQLKRRRCGFVAYLVG